MRIRKQQAQLLTSGFFLLQESEEGSDYLNFNWEQMLTLLIALLSVPSAYLGAKQATKTLHKNSRFSQLESRITRTEDAVQAVLHDSLYKQCTKVIYRGEVTISELDNIEHLYDGYHSVGGNGTGEALYAKVKSLPIINDEKLIEH